MATETTTLLNLELPVSNDADTRGQWGEILNTALKSLEYYAHAASLHTHYAPISSANVLGHQNRIITGASGSPLNFSVGVGKIAVSVNAGADLDGILTVIGTAYDKYTNTTRAVSEQIAISGTGVYVSQNVYVGSVTIELTSVDFSDYDVDSFILWDNRNRPFLVRYIGVDALNTAVSTTASVQIDFVDISTGKFDVFDTHTISFVTIADSRHWFKSKTLLSTLLEPNKHGIIVKSTAADYSLWTKLQLILEVQER